MQNVQLTLYNYSNDANNSDIVIFQKNVSADIDELAVAWKVVHNLAQGNHHPFALPLQMQVGMSDAWGNYSPKENAYPGQAFQVYNSTSGDSFGYMGTSTSSEDVEICNNLQEGAIHANIYKDSKLLATKTNVAPGQKAEFRFKPAIFIGVVSQVSEGDVMDSAILSQVNQKIDLLGISKADIYMSGGGPGPKSTPFQFTLQNIVRA